MTNFQRINLPTAEPATAPNAVPVTNSTVTETARGARLQVLPDAGYVVDGIHFPNKAEAERILGLGAGAAVKAFDATERATPTVPQSAPSGATPWSSHSEREAAYRDARYRTDANYRALVQARDMVS